MNLKNLLKKELISLEVDKETYNQLKKETEKIIKELKKEILNRKIEAEVFLGGSFAKNTLLKKDNYDIDIFVRFDWRLDKISEILEEIVKRIGKKLECQIRKIHGSRDYFKIEKEQVYFEIIPVYKIKKPKEARNVTDLSYFHVNYVKKRLKVNLAKEVLLAKQFCHAQNVYGAESYIQGFSGYGLECLIIYYKSFINMLKELSKVEDRIVLDPAKHYKNKNDVLFSLNESKLQSPIILADPTWKERNVLAALSKETFQKFQEVSKKFLKNPSEKFFVLKKLNIDELKKSALGKKAEFLHLRIETDRQEGDIAGTKMKKFSRFLESELRKYFDILSNDFNYSLGKKSDFYLVIKPKKEFIKIGPPVEMKEAVKAFKIRNRNTFEKNGLVHSREKINFSAREFLSRWKADNSEKMIEMGIVGMKIVED